eukprot:181722_1
MMDQEELLCKGAQVDYTNAQTHAHHNHPLKSTMQWLVEEKSNGCELVFVVDVDRSNESMLIVIKSDQSYHRVNLSHVKHTHEINQNEKWKLRQALFFATEQTRDNAIVQGSLLVEQYDKSYTTSSCLCFGRKRHKQTVLKGFKVKGYEWTESKLKGFETESMNGDAPKAQLQIMSHTSIVINESDPLQQELRAKQRTIDDHNGVIDEQDQTIVELRREMEVLKQQLQDSKTSVSSLRDELQFGNEKMQRLHNEHETLQKICNENTQNMNKAQHQLEEYSSHQDSKSIGSGESVHDESKFMKLHNEHQKLHTMYNEMKEQLKRVTTQRNELQDQLVEYSADLATLDTDFPPIQDIVTKFGETRGQSRLNCAKVIKKYFKSRNNDLHKLQINKNTDDALFNVLMTCHAKMKGYHALVYAEYKQTTQINNEEMLNKTCYRNVRKEFKTLYDKREREYLENVLDDIQSKYDGVFGYCSKELLSKYVSECLYVCWYIVVCQSPRLEFYPLSSDHVESGVTPQGDDGDDDEKSNAFNDSKYELAYGSEEEEALNYYTWPTIIRKDNNEQLSKIHALFLNDIPMYSKKGLKRRKAQSETANNTSLKPGI